MYNAIEACSDLLDHFGGHMYAAGLTLPLDKVEAFQHKFEEVVSQTITEDQLIPRILIDTPLELDQITPKFFHVLNQMEPFGPENLAPVFASKGVKLASSLKVIKEKHLKFTVKQDKNSKTFEAIAFGLAEYASDIDQDKEFSICYTVEENEFRGARNLQLNVKDIRFD